MPEEITIEPENMDQTDFIDNSIYSFAEADVFPAQTESVTNPTPTVEEKKPSKNQKLLLAAGALLLVMIITLLVLLKISQSRNLSDLPSENPAMVKQEQLKKMAAVDDQLYLLRQLTDSLVLPQVNKEILPD